MANTQSSSIVIINYYVLYIPYFDMYTEHFLPKYLRGK